MRKSVWVRVRAAALVVGVLASAGAVSIAVPTVAQAGPPVGSTAKFVPLAPQRVLDTREGLGAPRSKVAPRGSVNLSVLGAGGVPSRGVSAVVLNVTVTQSSGGGFVQVFPTGQSTPGAFSNISHTAAGQTIAGLVTAPVGNGGQVTLYTEAGGHLLADVLGYYAGSGATSDGRFVALSPSRILDTRTTSDPQPGPAPRPTASPAPRPTPTTTTPANPGNTRNCTDFSTQREAQTYFDLYYPYYGDVAQLDADGDLIACESLPRLRSSGSVKVAPRSSIDLQVGGAGGVPSSGVSAVALNITATQATASGFIQAVPTGGGTPIGGSSNINVTTGQTVANLVIVPLGSGGRVTLYSSSGAHLLADVAGYFTDSTAAAGTVGLFQALEPGRLLDTRQGGASKPADESQRTLTPGGLEDVPASGVSGVVLNLTAVGTTAPGFVQAFPTGRAAAGSSSNLNISVRGQVIANSTLATLGDGGSVTLYASKSTHLIADVFGYYLGGGAQPAPTVSPSTSPGGQQVLAGLRIAPQNTTVAYSRSSWPHWIDADSECQDTRAEVLIIESRTPAVLSSSGCTVVSGEWFDPYTGQTWTAASDVDVDVDHFVPLANAHRSGGHAWDTARKQAFANDLSNPAHLIAVEDGVNASKSDSGPEEWKPPRTAYWCTYATDWAGVKKTWELTVTQAEYDELTRMLTGC